MSTRQKTSGRPTLDDMVARRRFDPVAVARFLAALESALDRELTRLRDGTQTTDAVILAIANDPDVQATAGPAVQSPTPPDIPASREHSGHDFHDVLTRAIEAQVE